MSDQPNIELTPNRKFLLPILAAAALGQTLFASIYWSAILSRAGYETIGYVVACSGFVLLLRLIQNFKKPLLAKQTASMKACLASSLACNALLLIFADPWLLAAGQMLMLLAIENSLRDTEGNRLYAGITLPLFALLLPLFSIDMAINDWLGSCALYCAEPILRVPGILIADEEIPHRLGDELRVLPLDFSIRSLFGVPLLAAVGLTLVGLHTRRLFHSLLLLVSVGFWAVFGQTTYLVMLGAFFQLLFLDVTAELTSAIEISLAVMTILLIISTDQFLAFWFGPVTKESLESSSELVNVAGAFWNRRLASQVVDKPKQRHRDQHQTAGRLLAALAIASALLGGIGFVRFLAIERPPVRQLSRSTGADDFTIDPPAELIQYRTKTRNSTSSTGIFEYRWSYYLNGVQCQVSASELRGRWSDPAAKQKRQHWQVDNFTIDQNMQTIEMSKPSGERGLLFLKERTANPNLTTDPLGHFPTWSSPSLPEIFLRNRIYFRVFIQFFEEPDPALINQLKNNLDRLS